MVSATAALPRIVVSLQNRFVLSIAQLQFFALDSDGALTGLLVVELIILSVLCEWFVRAFLGSFQLQRLRVAAFAM